LYITFKKVFPIFLLQVYFKKVTEISSKTAKKVSKAPKTVHLKKYQRYR